MSTNEYQVPLDIQNRALQIVGASRISSASENSKNASAVDFAYDKVRKAEMRRNNWRFCLRYAALRAMDDDTMQVVPDAYDATQAYQPGAIVTRDSLIWQSVRAFNINTTPGTDNSAWDIYFGPIMASEYDATITEGYYAGEIVYKTDGHSRTFAFTSLADGTTADPATPTTWAALTRFSKGEVSFYAGFYYLSLYDLNTGNTPGAYEDFNLSTTYAVGAFVAASDGKIYQSLLASNLGNDPATSAAWWVDTGILNPWTPSFIGSTSGEGWLRQFATLKDPQQIYPIGTGPMSQSASRNLYHLPNGFLRVAPQEPKAGVVSYLGSPTGVASNDWLFEGQFLSTMQSPIIVLRFAADVTLVDTMDPMFCEGMAARLALDICEELTQSASKKKDIAAIYNKVMGEARIVNGIEAGPIEPPEDDYIAVRR